ncbi:MAG: transketolase [Pseudomonadota bacterium]
MTNPSTEAPRQMASAIAALSMDAVEQANSGHPGMPMGMADAATALFSRHLKFDASEPEWPDRDRFILSAGHGSMLIYSLLYLTGTPGVDLQDLKDFRQMGAKTAGHPEFGHAPGIETTTGPLGQGISNAVGFALAEAHLNARFGDEIVDHYTYVIAGDGCLMEGISQEAIAMAGHFKLRKLIVLWDDNGITIDGAVSLSDSTDQRARFEASGWDTLACDGHDQDAVSAAIEVAKGSDKPTLIACKTVIGKGANKKAGTAGAHGAPLGDEEIAFARESLNWPHAPFDIPADVLEAWRAVGAKGGAVRTAWEARLQNSDKRDAFYETWKADATPAVAALDEYCQKLASEKPKVATRKASQNALEVVNAAISTTLGGSADLTGSNNTKTGDLGVLSADNYAGRYIHYGIREHGMAAAMNGLALHGGAIPYGGTFLVFTDYARGAMRLSALMGQRVIYVMTHDSIGLGEDGPTHQPVEHLAALRAIPNLAVFRPADAVETAEAWAAALARTDGPSVLALTRQGLPTLREDVSENYVARGAYVLKEVADADVTLIGSGSEVEIAVEAAALLEKDGLKARIVSLPCVEAFAEQGATYMQKVLGTAPRLGLEAGVRMGWDHLLFAFGGQGEFMGVETFGASGPYKEVYAHFGLTAENAATKAKGLLGRS